MNDEKNIIINIKLSEDKIASRLQEIRKEIDRIENQNESLKKSLTLVGDNFGVVGKSIENNNKLIKELEKEYSTLESKLANNTKATQNYNESLNKTNKGYQDTSSNLQDLSNSIDKNSNSLESNKKELDRLTSSQKDYTTEQNRSKDSAIKFSDALNNVSTSSVNASDSLKKVKDNSDIKFNVDSNSLKDANTALNDLVASESRYGEATDLIRTRTNDLTGALIEETRQIQEISNDLRTVSDINVNVNTERSRDELTDLANTAVNTRNDIRDAVESIGDFNNVDLNIEGRVNINTNDAEQSLRNLERDVDRTRARIDDFSRNNKVDIEVDVKFDQSKIDNSIDELNRKLDTTKSKAREAKSELQTIEQLDFRRINVEDLNVPLDRLTDDAKQFGQSLLDIAVNSNLLRTALNNLGIEADSALSNVVKNLESFLTNWSKAGFSKAGAISAGLGAGFDIIANAIQRADKSTLELDEHLRTVKFQSSRTFSTDFAESLKIAADNFSKGISDAINSIPEILSDFVEFTLTGGKKSIKQQARENVQANVRSIIEERKEKAEAEIKAIQKAEESLKFKQKTWERDLQKYREKLNSEDLEERLSAQRRIYEIEKEQAEELYKLAERRRKIFEDALKETYYEVIKQEPKPTHRKGPRIDFTEASKDIPKRFFTSSDYKEIAEEEKRYEIKERDIVKTEKQQAAYDDLTGIIDKYREAKEKATKAEKDFLDNEADIRDIAKKEKQYSEDKRKYEDEELERRYEIQKLQSQEGDNTKAIYDKQKEGLEALKKLLKDREAIELKQQKVAGDKNEEETEHLHRTRLEIRKVELELEKLKYEYERTTNAAVGGLEEEDQRLKKIQEDQKQLAQAQGYYSRDQEQREQKIRELRRQDGDQSQQIYEIQKKGLEEYIELLHKRLELESDKAVLNSKDSGEFSEADLERVNRAALELDKYKNILKNLDAERDIAIKKKDEENKQRDKEEERLSKIAAKEREYNDARREYEENEVNRREELTKLEQDSEKNADAIRQKRIDGLREYLQVLDKQEKAVEEGIVDDKNKTEQEIQSLHRIKIARLQTQNEINRLQQESNNSTQEENESLSEQERQLADIKRRQEELNRESRQYSLDQIEHQTTLSELRRQDADTSEQEYNLERANLERKIQLLERQRDLYIDLAATNTTINEDGSLTISDEDLERVNRAKIELEKVQSALYNLDQERERAIQLADEEQQRLAQLTAEQQAEEGARRRQQQAVHDLNEARRTYELNEVDRRQRIAELRNEEVVDEERILEVRRESLTERLNLLNRELDHQQNITAGLNELTEEQIDAQHRLRLQIREVENEINNLSSGNNNINNVLDNASNASKGFVDNVKDATDALATLGIQGGSAIRRLITGFQKVGKLLTTGPMIAIAGIIAGITVLIKGISQAFEENEELGERLKEVYKSFEPILDVFKSLCEALAKVIIGLVGALGKLFRALAGTEEMYQNQITKARELKKATEELDKAKKEFALNEEKRNYRINELNDIVKDSELKSINERIKAQEEINKLKLQNLKDEEKMAWEAVRIQQETMNQAKKITDEMKDKLHELEVEAVKSTNALKRALKENSDDLVQLYAEFTQEELQIKIDDLKTKSALIKAEISQINELMNAVMYRGELEEAIIYLRERGVLLTQQEQESWEAIYRKLSKILPLANQYDKEAAILQEAKDRRKVRDAKNNTNTPKPSKEEEGPDYEKYWEDMFKQASKDLEAFHKELRDAEKDVEELGMTALEIFDRNLDETLKDIDARRNEIEAQIMEILKTPATTDQERERQQQSFDYYVEMWMNMEDLKTQISLKAAKDREKLEEEAILDSYDRRAQQLERYYKRQELTATMNQSGTTDPTKAKSLDPLSSSLMGLDQAKDELKLLMDTIKELDPASEAYQEFADKIVDANMKVIESQHKVIDEVVNTATSYMDAYGSIASSLASYYQAEQKSVENSSKTEGEKEALIEDLKRKEKNATVASIAFSTATALAKGIADAMTLVYPANIVAMITTISAVLSGIAQAKAAMAGYAEGGIIPGSSYSGDKVQARVNSGEMILTRKQQKQLFDIANGNGGNGFNYELMVNAFSNALTNMPSPVLDYQEFTTFSDNVASYNNLVKIK